MMKTYKIITLLVFLVGLSDSITAQCCQPQVCKKMVSTEEARNVTLQSQKIVNPAQTIGDKFTKWFKNGCTSAECPMVCTILCCNITSGTNDVDMKDTKEVMLIPTVLPSQIKQNRPNPVLIRPSE